jgi:flagellar motility protein MotE (MotC chaperone)
MTAKPAQARDRRWAPRFAWLAVSVFFVAIHFGVPARAAENSDKADKERDAADALPLPAATPQKLSPAEQYCSSVVDAAAAAQIAQQTTTMRKAQKQLDDRVARLAAKTEELKGWIKKREDFTAHATESLVEIYSKMDPEAAAHQLAAMDELTAAAITSKLSPKVSSLVLAEMDPTKAARLTAIIAGAGEVAMKLESKANVQQN